MDAEALTTKNEGLTVLLFHYLFQQDTIIIINAKQKLDTYAHILKDNQPKRSLPVCPKQYIKMCCYIKLFRVRVMA